MELRDHDSNIILMTDSYKHTHWTMYPKDMNRMYSYFESRQGATFPYTIFFGLQYLLKRYFEGQIVTKEKIDRAEGLINIHYGSKIFNRTMWERILHKHDGRLPLKIKAVPEGMSVPTENVIMTIESTDSGCANLVNFCETLLSHVWSGSTVATLSHACHEIIKKYLVATSGDLSGLDLMLWDFGYRGVSSHESAALCGAGHLVTCTGSDNLAAIDMILKYYAPTEMPALTAVATEHSVMTALGKEGEEIVMEQILDTYPNGILTWVIDSYDYPNFIQVAGTKFKEKILSRDGTLYFRPDSGDPVKTSIHVMTMLCDYFGYSLNSKGYKVLNPGVRMLWGDGIDMQGIDDILHHFWCNRLSASNIVFGMGGGLLQKINRDTQKCSYKCSYIEIDQVGHDICKTPELSSWKQSKKGRFKLVRNSNGVPQTVSENDPRNDILEDVFENGKLIRNMTFDEVRKQLK
jgi:nicotinamide phosphoribosyltransferase